MDYAINYWTEDYYGPDQTEDDRAWVEQWWETYPWTWELDNKPSTPALGESRRSVEMAVHPIDRHSYCRRRIKNFKRKERLNKLKPKNLWKTLTEKKKQKKD